jgi:hypothetical protein
MARTKDGEIFKLQDLVHTQAAEGERLRGELRDMTRLMEVRVVRAHATTARFVVRLVASSTHVHIRCP